MFDLSQYAGKRICVAVSGGRDSMALIDYIYARKTEFGITLSALNCDHGIRGLDSARDSAFVARWCEDRGVPLLQFVWEYGGAKSEQAARIWRRECYKSALLGGADYVATAHHMNDNAETVLFNLARGSAVAGLAGISDGEGIIHPLISVTRKEIEAYISKHSVPYVDDETNFSDGYTRNKIRHNVLPELEKAVPGAVGNIYRLSRLAAEDESYFQNLIESLQILKFTPYGIVIKTCDPVIFKRAAVRAIKKLKRVDYTAGHLLKLYDLSISKKNKKFEFLGLTAYAAEGKIVLTDDAAPPNSAQIKLSEYSGEEFFGKRLIITLEQPCGESCLKFDIDRLPETAVLRFKREGDRFTKFGGGTKSLGDYFTDKKIPLWVRGHVPLIADGNEILAVCGVEISDKIKVSDSTQNSAYIISEKFLL